MHWKRCAKISGLSPPLDLYRTYTCAVLGFRGTISFYLVERRHHIIVCCYPRILAGSLVSFANPGILFLAQQMVQQRKQEGEEEQRRQEAHALEREERAKIKQASLNKLQESWTTQTHTELSKPGGGKRGRGGEQGSGPAPQYESGSEDEAEELSENDEDEAGQADRYGDGAATSDAPAPLPPQPNLKDIGLSSSSDDSDDAFGGGDEEREAGAGQKRKWDSDDDEAGQGDQTASKRQTVEDD